MLVGQDGLMAYATTYSPPSAGTDQRFTYTCTGSEGDNFQVPLPYQRPSTNFVAVVTLLSSLTATQYLCNAPAFQYTTTTIQVITGTPVAAGDVLAVDVMGLG